MNFDTPRADELEITLLGRGAGECLVVHVGRGNWIVVDSFCRNGVPVAAWYLDELHADTQAIKLLVLTHLHADHYRGFKQLYDRYSDARVVVTGALQKAEHLKLRQLYPNDKNVLDGLPSVLANARRTRVQGGIAGYVEARFGQTVYRDRDAVVTAMSPMAAALEASERELEDALRHGWEAVTTQVQGDNKTSVVLHVQLGEVRALLCADLQADPPDCGWQAVVDEPTNRLDPVTLVKAAHHGGESGDHPAIWSTLAEPRPLICVAPFSSKEMPTATDVQRMCTVAGALWQAARSSSKEEWTSEDGVKRSGPGHLGLVRARRRPGEAHWRVDAVPPGRRVFPALEPA